MYAAWLFRDVGRGRGDTHAEGHEVAVPSMDGRQDGLRESAAAVALRTYAGEIPLEEAPVEPCEAAGHTALVSCTTVKGMKDMQDVQGTSTHSCQVLHRRAACRVHASTAWATSGVPYRQHMKLTARKRISVLFPPLPHISQQNSCPHEMSRHMQSYQHCQGRP